MMSTHHVPHLAAALMVLGLLFGGALAAEPARLLVPDPAAQITVDALPGEGSKVVLTCPRGGVVSAQVVVVAAAPLTALSANVSSLKGSDGAIVPPPQIRYGTRQRDLGPGTYDFGQSGTFDVLADACPPGEKVQPVWLTVRIPVDARPGDYTGTLTVDAGGTKLTIPIALTVATFTLKPPGERTFVHSVQASQESIALRYGVAPYSDAHFALLERQVALMGELGNNVLYVPLIGHRYLGHEIGLIHTRYEGATLVPDFTAFDRYFALYQKYCGTPKAVVVTLLTRYLAGRPRPGDDPSKVWLGVRQADGTLKAEQAPAYPENRDFWKATLDGLYLRLAKAGVGPEAVRFGDGYDGTPSKAQADFFREIAPKSKWGLLLHGYAGGTPRPGAWTAGEGEMSYGEYPDCYKDFTKPSPISRNWSWDVLTLCTMRDWHSDTGARSAPFNYRCLPDCSLGSTHGGGNSIGLARIGLDTWVLAPGTFGNPNARSIFARYESDGKMYRLARNDTRTLTAAGPAGHLTLQRFEMLREGVQETEARCFLEKCLVDPALKAKISDDLRTRCETLLIARLTAIAPKDGIFTNDSKWQQRSAQLYALADEMMRVIGE